MRGFAPLLCLAASSLLAADFTREDLLGKPKFSEARVPRFETFTPESLRDAVRVSSRRSYAAFGFNAPSVTVWLPMATNSIYSSFEFDRPKATDGRGRAVAFEIQQGIFDFDTSSNEIRFSKEGGTVDFAHAVGRVTVRYPLVVKTTSYRKGSSRDVTIDGPFVSYNSSAVSLPKEATFSKIHSLRAYDAKGRQLERSGSGSSVTKGNLTWARLAFWGDVAVVQIDRVERWGRLTIDYDLASPPRLPRTDQGLEPPLEERMKAATGSGGKVTKTVVVETPPVASQPPSPPSAPAPESSGDERPLTPGEARRKLAQKSIRATDSMLVMHAVAGRIEVVRLLLAAGVPIDSRSRGQTALIAAIRGKHAKLTQVLLDAGADVNAADENNATPLYFAAGQCAWTNTVRSLLASGAKTDPKTRGGATALQAAEWANCKENAKLISAKSR